jgi:NAD(P) transhydrogenase
MSERYDLVVIGCGPAGDKAATRAAYIGKRVAVIERAAELGGKCLRGGLPSKVLRDAALSYSGARRRLGDLFTTRSDVPVTMESLVRATEALCDAHVSRIRDGIDRHDIDLITGAARFVGRREVEVTGDAERRRLIGDRIVIATGSRPHRPGFIPFAEPGVYCSDTVLSMERLPGRLIVVGAGVIGCEYASIFASLDVDVDLIDINPLALPFLDGEINARLVCGLRERGVALHLGAAVEAATASGGRVSVTLGDGRRLSGDALLFSGGRIANTDDLGADLAGVELGRKGRPVVNESFQTSAPHIYAVGDVIGFPSLASTAMEQGRVAAAHAFAGDLSDRLDVMPIDACAPYPLIPIGIYTVPSVSMLGLTEQQAAASGRPTVVGRAPYSSRDRGLLIGDPHGFLKLVVDRDRREILGIHIVGEQAEELIHIGQACMHFGGGLEYFLRTVFNFPTLASLYKRAAYDVLSQL